MRIRYWFALLLIGAFIFANGQSMAADVPTKIGVVDIARLMRDSEPGKAGIKFIEEQQAGMQKQLDEIQSKLEKSPEDQQLMQELQKVYSSLQQTIQKEGANVANLIFDTVQKVLNKYREANGFAIILGTEAVASYSTGIDVTDAVLVEVNKEKVEFKASAAPGYSQPAPAPAENKTQEKKQDNPPAK